VPCVTTELLEILSEGGKRAEQQEISKHVAAAGYVGMNNRLASRPLFETNNTVTAGGTDIVRLLSQILGTNSWTTTKLQTMSVAHSFVLAMAMYPDVQKKAQAEIDAVVGHDRLPDFGDIDSLPFINAVVKESLRWQPVAAMGE